MSDVIKQYFGTQDVEVRSGAKFRIKKIGLGKYLERRQMVPRLASPPKNDGDAKPSSEDVVVGEVKQDDEAEEKLSDFIMWSIRFGCVGMIAEDGSVHPIPEELLGDVDAWPGGDVSELSSRILAISGLAGDRRVAIGRSLRE